MLRRIKIAVLGIVIAAACLTLGDRLPFLEGCAFISAAEAVVGRPLTPVSVAGVARRSARRCAAGVYNC
jgi:hypothetical protein